MNRRIVAHFVPRWPSNPYQSELAKHLGDYGVVVKEEDCVKSIVRYIRVHRNRPDIVHLHALPRFSSRPLDVARFVLFWWRIFKLRRLGVKYVWTVHDIAHHEAIYPRVDLAFSRILFRQVEGVIIHSTTARTTIENQWRVQRKDNVYIIPHGHYISSYSNSIKRDDARKRLQVPSGKMVFLFLGLIRPYKGVPGLIETFRSLPYDDIHLLIAGRPVSRELLRQIEVRARGCIRVQVRPRFVNDEEVQVYMNAADVVVFPYTKTLTTGALILAMSFGRACIAPRSGSIPDTLDDKGGFLYDPAAPSGLRDALESAIRRRRCLDDMGKYNRRRAEGWNWKDIARTTSSVYRQCLGSEHAGRTADPEASYPDRQRP